MFSVWCMVCVVWGAYRVQGSGFSVQVSGFRVQGSKFRVQGSGFRIQSSGFRILQGGRVYECWRCCCCWSCRLFIASSKFWLACIAISGLIRPLQSETGTPIIFTGKPRPESGLMCAEFTRKRLRWCSPLSLKWRCAAAASSSRRRSSDSPV